MTILGRLLKVGVATGAAVLFAPSVGAQHARLLAIRDDNTRESVRRFVEAAQRRGTPTEPLIAHALEGVAFKADAKRIEAAMAKLEKRMRTARDLLGSASAVDEIVAGADAIGNRVRESDLRSLRSVLPSRNITLPIGVLTELVAKGVASKTAAEMVRQLMARGANGAQFTELNAAVQQDVALGVSPIEALNVRVRGVMSLLPPPAPVSAAQQIRP